MPGFRFQSVLSNVLYYMALISDVFRIGLEIR